MNRRRLLHHALSVSAGLAVGSQISACRTPAEQDTSNPAPRVLMVFFSRAGENYYYGDRTHLKVGNTARLAEMISAAIDVDAYEIEAADPYPQGYEQTVDRNSREQRDDARPAIARALPPVERYDTVLLGSPVWSSQPPMIMRTFVDAVDLRGKQIHPFVTYAVSGLGNTVQDYAEWIPGSIVGEGLAVRGETVLDGEADVAAWLQRIGVSPR